MGDDQRPSSASARGTDAPGRDPGHGLSAVDAAARLAIDGPNVLPLPPRPAMWRQLAAQMVHFFALLFWVAGALAFVAGLPQLGVAVFFVILLNGLFAFVQERRAEQAAERLRDLLPRRATVVRDGVQVEIPAEDLVAGDEVVLGEGDRISADLQLGRVHALAVDTSSLTGESVPAHPGQGETVYAGSFVVEGEARAVVVATGSRTRLAGIAGLTREQRPVPTPLHRELARISRLIAVAAVTVGVGFFAVALLLGTSASRRLLVRRGCDRRACPGGTPPDGHPLACHRRAADGGASRFGAPSRGGRDARIDHVHLYRQDRHLDAQRNDRRRGVDAGRKRRDPG